MIEPGNAAMLAACTAAGFAREGILRQYLKARGKRIDVVIMSLIRADI